MLVAKRYVYVVFMCHLCLEKVLKGALVELTDIETPPRIHALRLFAERAGLALTDEQGSMLDELTAHQQKTRYPDAVMTLSKTYTRAYALRVIKFTNEFRTWLANQLKSDD